MNAPQNNDVTSLRRLLGAADHVDRLLAAKSPEQAVELAAELLLVTLGASGVVVFAKGAQGLEEQWAAGQLDGEEVERRELAAEVLESGEVTLRGRCCALPLTAGRVYAVLVVQGEAEVSDELASLLALLGSRGLESAALRVAAAKQQHLRLTFTRFLNPSLVRTVVRGDAGETTAPELRPVSTLCLEFEGYRSQVDVIGPDRMLSITHQFFETIVDTLYEHEATVIELSLDGVMAVFGAPIPLDETTAADLAASAGLALIEESQRLSERWGIDGLPVHIKVRAGLTSGPVQIGAFGPSDRPVLTAIGPFVSLAKKLASQSKVGELVVDSNTRTFLAERLSTRSIGAVEVSGLDYPIFAYTAQCSIK